MVGYTTTKLIIKSLSSKWIILGNFKKKSMKFKVPFPSVLAGSRRLHCLLAKPIQLGDSKWANYKRSR